MTITCIFNRQIYCDFDAVDVAKYLAEQEGILNISYEKDKFC